MSVSFAGVKAISIPEGEVKSIVSGGVTLWEKASAYLSRISVYGNSTQVTTTGKNLFPPDAQYWTNRSVNGTTLRTIAIPLAQDESITWHRNSSGPIGTTLWVCETLGDEVTATSIVSLAGYGSYTYTNSDGHAYALFTLSTSYGMGVIAEREGQVERGSSFTSYEPYTGGAASPRPDWPQAIESVDTLTLYMSGKNVTGFDYSSADSYPNAGTYNYRYSDPVQLKPSTAYTWSQTGAGSTSGYLHARVYTGTDTDLTSTGTNYRLLNNGTWVSSVSFTTGPTGIIRFVYLSSHVDLDAVAQASIMLEEGSTASTYEAYSGGTVTIDLQGYELRMLPDGTCDTLSIDSSGNVTLTQNVGAVDLGTLSWTRQYAGQTYEKFTATVSDMTTGTGTEAQCMCASYLGVRNRGMTYELDEDTIALRATRNMLMLRDANYTDASTLTTALNGVTLCYALAESATVSLGTVTLPEVPADTATVWATGGSADPSSVTWE